MINNPGKSTERVQFEKIQSKLVGIVSEMGSQRGRNRRASEISAYLYLHKEITQKQLIKLTGFSAGTISTSLNSYIEQGFVKKEFREDPRTKKPKYYYSVVGTFASNLSTLMKQAQLFLPLIAQKMQQVKVKLGKPGLEEKKGYSKLISFTKNMDIYLQEYGNLMQKLQNTRKRSKDE